MIPLKTLFQDLVDRGMVRNHRYRHVRGVRIVKRPVRRIEMHGRNDQIEIACIRRFCQNRDA